MKKLLIALIGLVTILAKSYLIHSCCLPAWFGLAIFAICVLAIVAIYYEKL